MNIALNTGVPGQKAGDRGVHSHRRRPQCGDPSWSSWAAHPCRARGPVRARQVRAALPCPAGRSPQWTSVDSGAVLTDRAALVGSPHRMPRAGVLDVRTVRAVAGPATSSYFGWAAIPVLG